jgi:hypothetical protein
MLAAGALLLASLAVAILFARLLEHGGAVDFVRVITDHGSIEGALGQRADANTPDGGTGIALTPSMLPSPGAVEDPQLAASQRSLRHDDAGVAVSTPFQETWARGHLVSVDGASSIHAGDECWVRVLPVGGAGYNCLVRVMCGGTLLYPDNAQQAGYAPCDVEGGRVVRGSDTNTSGRDGDPTLDLDLRRGDLTVHDVTPQQGEPFFRQLGAAGVRTFSARIALDPPRA